MVSQAETPQYLQRQIGGSDVLPQGEERQFYVLEAGVITALIWITRRSLICRHEIDDESDDGGRQKRNLPYALAAPLDLPDDLGMTASDQPPAKAFKTDPVIADQPCKKPGAFGRFDQAQGDATFAGSGCAADQDAGLFDHDRAGMNISWSLDFILTALRAGRFPAGGHRAFGSQSRSRAPSTAASPSSPIGPIRLIADMRPPWASMIWREIESPRPEFWPKP